MSLHVTVVTPQHCHYHTVTGAISDINDGSFPFSVSVSYLTEPMHSIRTQRPKWNTATVTVVNYSYDVPAMTCQMSAMKMGC